MGDSSPSPLEGEGGDRRSPGEGNKDFPSPPTPLPQGGRGVVIRRVARLLLDVALVYGLFWASHTVYRGSTGTIQMCDSTYSLVAAQKWLADGTLNVVSVLPDTQAARAAMPGYNPGGDMPYHLIRHTDPRHPDRPPALYYGYPLGSVVLSLPWVRHYVTDRGMDMIHPGQLPSYAVEGEVQLRIASRVAALTVALFYVIARFFCPPVAALLLTAAFAFASPVWSTLARALWSHTWMVFWLSAAIALLLTARRVKAPTWRTDLPLGVGLGTAIFWMGFCRQHAVFSAAAIGLFLLLHHRRLLLVAGLAGGAWAAALVAASMHTFGTTLPPSVYSPNTIDGQDMANRFFWLMLSPSRGLLVFCPYLLVTGAMLVAFRRSLPDPAILLPCGVAVGMHTAMFSAYNGWHGGTSFGPRYFCDVLPWFLLASAVAVRGMLNAPSAGFPWRKVAFTAALVAGFGWGLFVHYRGANSIPVWLWNHRAIAVTEAGAVKDWRHPQFLTGITFDVLPDGTVVEK